MATLHRHPTDGTPHKDVATEPAPIVTVTGARARSLAVLRLGFGLTFLWAFFDKRLALGFSTGRDPVTDNVDRFGDAAWIHGGSPTAGFLGFAAKGPFKDVYNHIAGDAWADWLFMLGLLGIGLALTLGIGIRFAGAAGALLYVMMWSVVLPPANHPLLDEHRLGAVTRVGHALARAGDPWGLGRRWSRVHLVEHNAFLR